MDGWAQPYEGDVYQRDFVEHGMNVWPGEMSKSDMRKWGVRQLRLSWGSTEGVRNWVARLMEEGGPYTNQDVCILLPHRVFGEDRGQPHVSPCNGRDAEEQSGTTDHAVGETNDTASCYAST